MSADATNSSKHSVDCVKVAREEIIEKYLVGTLSEEDRDAFEEHYFECARCFEDLQSLRAIRDELRLAGAEFETRTTRPFLRWAPAAGMAAALVLAVAVLVWMSRPPEAPPEATNTQLPSRVELSEKPQPSEPDSTVASEPSLDQLARFEPPRYEPLTLRGAPDESTERFRQGMERYRKADYEGAVVDLRAAAELDPDAAHIRFLLGISQLMLGQDSDAIDRLRATIELGDSPYLEEAHWYLAKAFMRRKDLGAAESQLQRLIQLGGSWSGEAGQLLMQVERLKQRSG
jgi:tetratricopeptide (TPR) repeat protein